MNFCLGLCNSVSVNMREIHATLMQLGDSEKCGFRELPPAGIF
jgi:hypothetical protein